MAATFAKKKGTRKRESSTRRRLALIGLAVFLVLDVALVGWAITANNSVPEALGGPLPAASSSPSTLPTVPEPVEGSTSVPEPVEGSPDPDAVPATRIISALDANTAWRSSIGVCPSKKPTLELTTDAGETWTESNISGPTGAAGLLTLKPTSETLATAVVLGADGCTPQYVQTYVAGDNWASYPERLEGTWFVVPSERGAVHTPQGDKKAPCTTVVAFAARDDNAAAVLCSDQSVYRTTDAGSTWKAPVTIPGAAAIDVSGNGYVFAVTDNDSCDGVQLVTLAASATDAAKTSGECMSANFKPGEIAISQADATLWLWAGKKVSRTDDGGRIWQ